MRTVSKRLSESRQLGHALALFDSAVIHTQNTSISNNNKTVPGCHDMSHEGPDMCVVPLPATNNDDLYNTAFLPLASSYFTYTKSVGARARLHAPLAPR